MSGGHWEYLQYRFFDIAEDVKKGADAILKAQVYMQRIDYLLSGDDGEETFLKRLKEDLSKL
jgi:hypothetical protein